MTWNQFVAVFLAMNKRVPTKADIVALKQLLGFKGADAHLGNEFLSALAARTKGSGAAQLLIGSLNSATPSERDPLSGGQTSVVLPTGNTDDKGKPGGNLGGSGPGAPGTVVPPYTGNVVGPDGTVQLVPGGAGGGAPDDYLGPDDDEGTPRDGEDEDEEETPEPKAFDGDLMATIQGFLEQYGLDTPGLLEFARNAIAEGWSYNQILLELRKHPDYLANPLFAANIERTRNGARFMSEGEVLGWSTEAKRISKQWGYDVPDSYLAQGLLSGISLAEIEHRIQVQRRVEEMGAGVKWVYENILGVDISDADLFEIFDPETDTYERDQAYKHAQYRGQPMLLGLGIRSEAEARALEMLGVDPTEAFKRYESVGMNRPRFERLASIEDMISEGLPEDFGAHMMTAENGLLVKGLVFNDPKALAELQAMTSREIARFKVGGGAQSNNQGQLVGLLSRSER